MQQRKLIKKFPNKFVRTQGTEQTFEKKNCKKLTGWQDEAAALKAYRIFHVFLFCNIHTQTGHYNKMLSYRRETALQGTLYFSQKVKDWNWETMFYGHYRSIFNHCDIISLKICRIRWKTQNKGYYAVQGHSRSWRSVPIESPYATSY